MEKLRWEVPPANARFEIDKTIQRIRIKEEDFIYFPFISMVRYKCFFERKRKKTLHS